MSVVLTIEPDPSQAEALRSIFAGRDGMDLVLVTSKDAAIAAIDRQVPDLMLVSALLSPRDEGEIVAHLRSIDDAGHLQTLTIPQLQRADDTSRTSSFFGFQKKRPAAAPTGCDPAVFAEEVATYLARPRDVRSQTRMAHRDVAVGVADLPLTQSEPATDVVAPIVANADAFVWNADERGVIDERSEETAVLENLPVQPMEPPSVEPFLPGDDDAATEIDRLILQLDVDPTSIQLVEPEVAAADPADLSQAALDLLAADVARVQAEAEARLAVELERVREEAAEHRLTELARLQAEAAASREMAIDQARQAAEAEARDALVAELARVQADAEERCEVVAKEARQTAETEASRTFAEELSRVRTDAEQTLTSELTRVRSEAERTLAAEVERARDEANRMHGVELARVQAEAEARAVNALETEVARVRAEAESRLQATVDRVRQEAEDARLVGQSAAHLEAERIRETATREAREIAEAAANRTLDVEIQRARAEADSWLAAEMAQLRIDTEQRRATDLAEIRAQVASMRDAAAQQARSAAAEAIAAEIARSTAGSAPVEETGRVRVVRRASEPSPRREEPAPPAQAVSTPRTAAVTDANVDYYSLWRAEGEPSVPARSQPAGLLREGALRRGRAKLVIAASLLLVPSVSVDTSWVVAMARQLTPAAVAVAPPAAAAQPAKPARPANPVGRLLVESTPPGARVFLDGKRRGESPLTLQDVSAGKHTLVLESGEGTVTRVVEVRDGRRTIAHEVIMPGWLAVFCRIPLQVHVGGRQIGTTAEGRLMLAPGVHEVTLVSERFNYRETKTFEIQPGVATPYTVSLPTGTVQVNAPAGAEVWVEGEPVGQAPLGELQVPIGTREIVARHPDLGERRNTVEVRHQQRTAVTF